MAFQVLEKDSVGTDWRAVRYFEKALTHFDTEDAALAVAKQYITHRNVNNVLTKDEKLAAVEVYMETPEGMYLGQLDGQAWFATYPKDTITKDPKSTEKTIIPKGALIRDRKNLFFDRKAEVCVKKIPGT